VSEPYTPSVEEARLAWTNRDADVEQSGAQFDRMIAAVRAEAWDEGLKAGLREGNDKAHGVVNNPALNPYRKAQS